MRRFIFALLSCLLALAASSNLATAGQENQTQYQIIAKQTLARCYPFERQLFDCSIDLSENGICTLRYCFKQSETAIFTVTTDAIKVHHIEYNDRYTLMDYYNMLCLQYGGTFRFWPVAEKAWFAPLLSAHRKLDAYRETHGHPDWLPSQGEFLITASAHTHALPDADALSQEDAYQLAVQYLWQTEKIHIDELPDLMTAVCYYADIVDEAQQNPVQWVFSFHQRGKKLYDIWINAYSGAICRMQQEQALSRAKEALSGRLPQEAIDSTLYAAYYVETDAPYWLFKALNGAYDIRVAVDDSTATAQLLQFTSR